MCIVSGLFLFRLFFARSYYFSFLFLQLLGLFFHVNPHVPNVIRSVNSFFVKQVYDSVIQEIA